MNQSSDRSWAVVKEWDDDTERIWEQGLTKDEAIRYVHHQGGALSVVQLTPENIVTFRATESAFRAKALVAEERAKQDERFGPPDNDLLTWLAVLGEEYGELCQAVLQAFHGGVKGTNIKLELVQLTAVGMAFLEQLEREQLEREEMAGKDDTPTA